MTADLILAWLRAIARSQEARDALAHAQAEETEARHHLWTSLAGRPHSYRGIVYRPGPSPPLDPYQIETIPFTQAEERP